MNSALAARRRPGALPGLATLVLLGLWAGLALGPGAPAVARAQPGAPVALAAADADPGLRRIAPGFDLWLRETLGRAGLTAEPTAQTGLAALPAAASRGAGRVVVPVLRAERGTLSIRLLVYAPDTREVLASAHARAPLDDLGPACREALDALLPALGASPVDVTPPLLGDLASASRALELRDRGETLRAWQAVGGRLSPVAMAVRESIADAARRGEGTPAERARVLAATGDTTGAWSLVGSTAQLELGKRRPAVPVLLAAAEVQLAHQNPRVALRYLDVALTHAPDDPDLQLALGRVRALQGDADAARHAFERAARLAPDDPRPWSQLAELDAGHSERTAAHHLELGVRTAVQLEPQRARRQLARAAQLDASLAARSAVALGDLESRLGRPAEAVAAYREATRAGVSDPAVHVAAARAHRALGDDDAAERSLRRAVKRAPDHVPAVVELGALLAETQRPDEARPLLERARRLGPDDDDRFALARGLRLVGSETQAYEVLVTGEPLDDPRLLREAAASQRALGDLAGARESLGRAIELEPTDPTLRDALAGVLEDAGEPAAADDARVVASRLAGEASAAGGDVSPASSAEVLADFDALVMGFAARVQGSGGLGVAHLGVREPRDWRTWLRRAVRPRSPDAEAIEAALARALDARFTLAPGPDGDGLDAWIDRLYAFDAQDSLSAEVIAGVNGVLGTDGIFVTRVIAHPGDHAAVACAPGTLGLETRLLRGDVPEYVQILAKVDCVSGGLDVWGRWNAAALGLYGLGLLLLARPVLRGWGAVVVRIRLPEKTKGFFSIHITRRSDQVQRQLIDKKTGREKLVARRRVPDLLRRFDRHMAGRETSFRWIPVRKAPYTVTVGGPLLDARGEEVIGHFLEEQKVRVQRGAPATLDFDFRPKECAVQVHVAESRAPAPGARVAVQGDPSSLRYARDGVAFLYVGKGEYTILVGGRDAVAACNVFIERLDAAVPLHVDLAEADAVFRGCPEAVEPFLVGDLATAADALARAGDANAAGRLRAELLERQGRSADAAREFEAAGDLEQAAELRASGEDLAGSASLFEQAGDPARAADAYRAAGSLADAARCYEEVYDYANALECWREVGDEERELALLEKLGEFMDAAEIARGRGEDDRAIANLQQVDHRHPSHGHACRLIAEMLSERGDHELAVAKFEEALSQVRVETASADVLESYANVLERAGRHEQALSAWEAVARRDACREGVSSRIQALRREIEQQAATAVAGAGREPSTVAVESRYELLEEIGRGGMGVVYKARDKRLGRVVALKRMPDNLRDHPTAVALFEREARAAAALNHQNIVTLFDAGEEDGNYFITMELLEGRALNEILVRHGRISVRDTARIGVQIAAGLQYAHDRRIVHRDIKTANLFFTNDQVVKIMDFGIAKSLEEVRRSTTVVGGTPYYMAPEQASGQPVDHRADLYAFGVTLFQLATGTLPFSEGDVTYLHVHEPPPDPREIDVGIPEPLAALVLRLLGKRPEERPESAAEVAAGLRAVLQELAG